MYAKIRINGNMEVVTGMHIGGSDAFSAIGAVDKTVVRDIRTGLPMVPGSSLKGKLRTLLARSYNDNLVDPADDDKRISRLFGSAKKNEVHVSRLIFGDMFLANEEELRKQGLQTLTEVKFENGINRVTSVANPRQIERTVRGSRFDLDLVYDIHCDKGEEEKALAEATEDMHTLAEGLRLLEYDYLGGHGTRGYGKVRFNDIKMSCIMGDIAIDNIAEWEKALVDAIGH